MKFRYDGGFFIEPHFRLYNQTAANFYLFSIEQETYGANGFPEYASADYRLDEFEGTTLGVNVGKKFPGHGVLRVRLEQIKWTYENSLFDENNAFVLQVSYKKLFE